MFLYQVNGLIDLPRTELVLVLGRRPHLPR